MMGSAVQLALSGTEFSVEELPAPTEIGWGEALFACQAVILEARALGERAPASLVELGRTPALVLIGFRDRKLRAQFNGLPNVRFLHAPFKAGSLLSALRQLAPPSPP
jgi:hypothetical protein